MKMCTNGNVLKCIVYKQKGAQMHCAQTKMCTTEECTNAKNTNEMCTSGSKPFQLSEKSKSSN